MIRVKSRETEKRDKWLENVGWLIKKEKDSMKKSHQQMLPSQWPMQKDIIKEYNYINKGG